MKELGPLTLPDVLAFYKRHLMPGGAQRKKMSIRISGPKAPAKGGTDHEDIAAKAPAGAGASGKGAAAGSRGASAKGRKRQKQAQKPHEEVLVSIQDMEAFRDGATLHPLVPGQDVTAAAGKRATTK